MAAHEGVFFLFERRRRMTLRMHLTCHGPLGTGPVTEFLTQRIGVRAQARVRAPELWSISPALHTPFLDESQIVHLAGTITLWQAHMLQSLWWILQVSELRAPVFDKPVISRVRQAFARLVPDGNRAAADTGIQSLLAGGAAALAIAQFVAGAADADSGYRGLDGVILALDVTDETADRAQAAFQQPEKCAFVFGLRRGSGGCRSRWWR